MLDIKQLDDIKLGRLIENRWEQSSSLWEKMKKEYEKNYKVWKNDSSLTSSIPKSKSHTVDNRVFLAVESVISNLTARPSKPDVRPANKQPESGAVAADLQDLFLEIYDRIGVKKKMKKGLRWLMLSKLICLKCFWNAKTDDIDLMTVDPRRVRINKDATNPRDAEVVIEEIECGIDKMIARFPDKTDVILNSSGGGKEEDAVINGIVCKYKEAWLNGGEWVVYKYNNLILKKERNPYWDFEGVLFDQNELRDYTSSQNPEARMNALKSARGAKEERAKDETGKYKGYLLNHFDYPLHPYIFGTVLEVDNSPIGETSLVNQVLSLQVNINKRKRQIADNAAAANGRWKIDTKFCEGKSKGEWQAMKSDPQGIIIGEGVNAGLTVETGRDLPSMVRDDLLHSIQELDAVFGTQSTFRGEQGTKETATGRAILREQSFLRLNELVDLVDDVHSQLYNWWMQFIRTRYNEVHYIKVLGRDRTMRIVEILGDNIEDGIEVKVVPGQILPRDKVYRAERAFEGVQNAIITPLTYFEEAEFDNPMEEAKRLEMYKANPFSILDMDQEDVARLAKAFQLLQGIQTMSAPEDPRAKAVAEMRARTKKIVESPEFNQKSKEEQAAILSKLKAEFNQLTQIGADQKPQPVKK